MNSAKMIPARFVGPLLCVLASTFLIARPRAHPRPDLTASPADSTADARLAAERWLRAVDTSAWGEAWEAASVLLTDSLSEEAWREQGRAARHTLGDLRSRRVVRAQLQDRVEGVSAEGPFVMLRFRSEFEGGLYVESVLVAWAEEAWRVAGYEVAPLATVPFGGGSQNQNGTTG